MTELLDKRRSLIKRGRLVEDDYNGISFLESMAKNFSG
jgi:hypothetical protein